MIFNKDTGILLKAVKRLEMPVKENFFVGGFMA
jgi:hypothetical protein